MLRKTSLVGVRMPIFQFDSKLVYYAHIPKTAGTTISKLLCQAGAKQHFVASLAHRAPKKTRLVNLPPQHITTEHFKALFDPSGFAGVFAFLRHPEDRMISEYRFRHVRGGIHAKLSFTDWVWFTVAAYEHFPYLLEGHILPQHQFLIPRTKTFKLEDGFDPFFEWAGETFGIDIRRNGDIERYNASNDCDVRLTRESRTLINAFYRKDFEALGYAPREISDLPSDKIALGKKPFLKSLGGIYALARQ